MYSARLQESVILIYIDLTFLGFYYPSRCQNIEPSVDCNLLLLRNWKPKVLLYHNHALIDISEN